MANKNVGRAFVNKRTGQRTITLPKKLIRQTNPTLKSSDELLIEWSIFHKKKKK